MSPPGMEFFIARARDMEKDWERDQDSAAPEAGICILTISLWLPDSVPDALPCNAGDCHGVFWLN